MTRRDTKPLKLSPNKFRLSTTATNHGTLGRHELFQSVCPATPTTPRTPIRLINRLILLLAVCWQLLEHPVPVMHTSPGVTDTHACELKHTNGYDNGLGAWRLVWHRCERLRKE